MVVIYNNLLSDFKINLGLISKEDMIDVCYGCCKVREDNRR